MLLSFMQIFVFDNIMNTFEHGMTHQIFKLYIVSVSHLMHIITIYTNNMILALVDFLEIFPEREKNCFS